MTTTTTVARASYVSCFTLFATTNAISIANARLIIFAVLPLVVCMQILLFKLSYNQCPCQCFTIRSLLFQFFFLCSPAFALAMISHLPHQYLFVYSLDVGKQSYIGRIQFGIQGKSLIHNLEKLSTTIEHNAHTHTRFFVRLIPIGVFLNWFTHTHTHSERGRKREIEIEIKKRVLQNEIGFRFAMHAIVMIMIIVLD